MHELSIAQSLVEVVEEAAKRAGATRVRVVRLRLGALSGVVAEALRFCYDLVVEGTMLEGSRLDIEEVPAALWCEGCQRLVAIELGRGLYCPGCGSIQGDLRQGKELEVRDLEIDVPSTEEQP